MFRKLISCMAFLLLALPMVACAAQVVGSCSATVENPTCVNPQSTRVTSSNGTALSIANIKPL